MNGARISLGKFRITALQAGVYYPDGGCMFGIIPKDQWAKAMPANHSNRIALTLNCYVVESDEHTVVLETGGGVRVDPDAPNRGGLVATLPLPELMSRAGIDPSAVDIVINSHLHWDHCGGNTTVRDGRIEPAFPRAKYYCSKAEWEHAHKMNPRDAISYDPRNFDPLVRSGRMDLVEGDYQPAPGIRMHSVAGHCGDLQLVTVESGGGTFCFLSDLVPTSAHLPPTWIAAFDLFPLESLASKTKWLSRAASNRWICGFAHDPKVGAGVVNKRFALEEDLTERERPSI